MEIQRLDAESYAGQRFTARYQTNGYYDISVIESGFQIEYKPFELRSTSLLRMCFSGSGWMNP